MIKDMPGDGRAEKSTNWLAVSDSGKDEALGRNGVRTLIKQPRPVGIHPVRSLNPISQPKWHTSRVVIKSLLSKMNGLNVTKSLLASSVAITMLHFVGKSMSLDVLLYACPWAAATRTFRGSFNSSEHLPVGTGSYLIPIRFPPFAACVDRLVLA